MNERAKVSVSWIVTVVMVPIIAFSGIRMVMSIDTIGEAVQEMKVQQAVTNHRLLVLETHVVTDR